MEEWVVFEAIDGQSSARSTAKSIGRGVSPNAMQKPSEGVNEGIGESMRIKGIQAGDKGTPAYPRRMADRTRAGQEVEQVKPVVHTLPSKNDGSLRKEERVFKASGHGESRNKDPPFVGDMTARAADPKIQAARIQSTSSTSSRRTEGVHNPIRVRDVRPAVPAITSDSLVNIPPTKKEKPSLLRSFSLRSKSRPSSPTDPTPLLQPPKTPKTGKIFGLPRADRPSDVASPRPPRSDQHAPLLFLPKKPALELKTPKSAKRAKPTLPDLPLPPLRRSTSHSLPSAPLPPPPLTLRLDPALPGGEYEPTLVSAIGQGENERKRGFLRGLLGRNKKDDVPPIPDVPALAITEVTKEATISKPSAGIQGDIGADTKIRKVKVDSDMSSFEEITHQDGHSMTSHGSASIISNATVESVKGGKVIAEGAGDLVRHRDSIDLAAEVDRLNVNLKRSDTSPHRNAPSFSVPSTDRSTPSAPVSNQEPNDFSSGHRVSHALEGGVKNIDETVVSSDSDDNTRLNSDTDDDLDDDIGSDGSSASTPTTPISPIPTTFLGKTFEGLPFGPDVPVVSQIRDIRLRSVSACRVGDRAMASSPCGTGCRPCVGLHRPSLRIVRSEG